MIEADKGALFFVGVYGRAMGGLAIEMLEQGWKVYGSGATKFPPMSGKVDAAGVKVLDAVDELPADVGTVIVSGTLGRKVPFVEKALNRGVRVVPFARFLEERFLWKSRNLLVAGTNGKTTTAAMLLHILRQAGKDPDCLIGGELRDGTAALKMRGADVAVLEGDEYLAGFGDRNPKFLYYRPRILGVTNMVFDHPEAYRDGREYRQLFAFLLLQVPGEGAVVLSADDPALGLLKERSPAPVTTVGFSEGADERIVDYDRGSFTLRGQGVRIALFGRMNARNAAMAMLMAEHEGIELEESAKALAEFSGVAERQEIVHDSERAAVVVEEAYHPDSLKECLAGLGERFPGRRLVLVLFLRFTGGGDQYHQENLPRVLGEAGVACLIWLPPFNYRTFSTVPFDEARFAADLSAHGVAQVRVEKRGDLVPTVADTFEEGDVLVISIGIGPRDVADGVVAML